MNLRQLSYFVAITEHKSFLKASQALHISQPSVSAQINLLEQELSVQLFERRPAGTVLTPEGKDFLVHARHVLDAVEAARASLPPHHAREVGQVTIGIPGSLSAMLILPLIEIVRRECPDVRLRVVAGLSGHLFQWIQSGEVNFALVFASAPVAGVDIEPLISEHLAIAARCKEDLASRLDEKDEIRLADLRGLPLVMPSKGHGLRKTLDDAAKATGVNLYVRTELDAHELLTEMVRHTDCFTVLSLAALQSMGGPKPLFTARIVEPYIQRRVCLAHASGRPLSRAARRVDGILRELLQQEIDRGWWANAKPIGRGSTSQKRQQ